MEDNITLSWLYKILSESNSVTQVETASADSLRVNRPDGSSYLVSVKDLTKRSGSVTKEAMDKEYAKSHTKEEFVEEIMEMADKNFYLYLILLSLLKMKELGVITLETADELFGRVIPFEDKLLDDFSEANSKWDVVQKKEEET